MRRPRTMGLPPKIFGSTVMRFKSSRSVVAIAVLTNGNSSYHPRQLSILSPMPHRVAFRSQLLGQLDLHPLRGFIRHRVEAFEKLRQQPLAQIAHEAVRLDAGLVVLEALAGWQAGHPDINARHARAVTWIARAESAPLENRRIELDD